MCCGATMVDRNVHKYSSDKALTTDDYARCKRKIKKSHDLYRLNVNKIDGIAIAVLQPSHWTRLGLASMLGG